MTMIKNGLPSWSLIPEELVLNIIFPYISHLDLVNLLLVSKTFHFSQCAQHDQYWEPVYHRIISRLMKSNWIHLYERVLPDVFNNAGNTTNDIKLLSDGHNQHSLNQGNKASQQYTQNFKYKSMLNRVIHVLSSDSFTSLLIKERRKMLGLDKNSRVVGSPSSSSFFFTLSQLERRDGEKLRNLLSVNCSCFTSYHPYLILLGASEAGKTSLQSRACMDQYPYEPIIGGDEYHLTYNSRIFRFTMGETELTQHLNQRTHFHANYRDEIVYLLCFDVNSEKSLLYVKNILIPGLNSVRNCSPLLLILVGLKMDQTGEQKWGNVPISLEEGELFAKTYGCAVYFETSAKTGEGLGRGFWELMAKCVIGHHNFHTHGCEIGSPKKSSCILS